MLLRIMSNDDLVNSQWIIPLTSWEDDFYHTTNGQTCKLGYNSVEASRNVTNLYRIFPIDQVEHAKNFGHAFGRVSMNGSSNAVQTGDNEYYTTSIVLEGPIVDMFKPATWDKNVIDMDYEKDALPWKIIEVAIGQRDLDSILEVIRRPALLDEVTIPMLLARITKTKDTYLIYPVIQEIDPTKLYEGLYDCIATLKTIKKNYPDSIAYIEKVTGHRFPLGTRLKLALTR